MRSQIIIEEFHSQALEGNPLGDPATRRVPVYLPPGYDKEKRYPSLYLLAGFGSRGLRFLNDDIWSENIQEQLDRLILSGQVQPLILVLPDCSSRYGGSQYLNSAAIGNYEDALLELVEYIDKKYPTMAGPDRRAIAGHSSGGFGAITMGMRHPDVFGLVADHSGDKNFEMTFKVEFGDALRYYEQAGEEGIATMLADPGKALSTGTPHGVLSFFAMAAVYSPNPKAKFGFELPFDLHNGELRPEVWERWLAHDPVELVGKYAQALRSLKLLYIDCGRFDEYNLLYGARLLTEKLRALDIPFLYEEYDGSHRYMRHRYDVSFTAISAAMSS